MQALCSIRKVKIKPSPSREGTCSSKLSLWTKFREKTIPTQKPLEQYCRMVLFACLLVFDFSKRNSESCSSASTMVILGIILGALPLVNEKISGIPTM